MLLSSWFDHHNRVPGQKCAAGLLSTAPLYAPKKSASTSMLFFVSAKVLTFLKIVFIPRLSVKNVKPQSQAAALKGEVHLQNVTEICAE